MNESAMAAGPVLLSGLSTTLHQLNFIRDPLAATRKLHTDHGPFIVLGPVVGRIPNKPYVVAVGAKFNRDVLGAPNVWRPLGLVLRGPKNSAQSRLRNGVLRIVGKEHAYYRRLLERPLRRARVDTLGEPMTEIVESELDNWSVGESVDLWALVQQLVQRFAFTLLFGNERKGQATMVELLQRHLTYNLDPLVFACPLDVPGTRYRGMLRHAEAFERAILDWIREKRGHLDENDLVSIVVNKPDENGACPADAKIVGHIPTLFIVAYETCQTALIWSLVLLAQNPNVARQLYDEVSACGSAGSDRILRLSLLDAVVKESIRMLPPVPVQMRTATANTSLDGYPLPQGTRIWLSGHLTNRLPDLYPNPDEFRPQRWFSIDPSAYEYMSFSAGPRACIGYWFGTNLVKISLATIMRRYRIALLPDSRVDYKIRLTLEPANALFATIFPQDGKFSAAPIRGNIARLISPQPHANRS